MLKNLLRTTLLLSFCWMPSAGEAQDDPNYMMALNLYHEGRGEGAEGMIAVGWVVLNRVEETTYPDNVVDVITQTRGNRCEWGWWCDGKSDKPTEPELWAQAQELAESLLGSEPPADPTEGALWFQETFRDRPAWMGDHVVQTVTIGNHNFYGLR